MSIVTGDHARGPAFYFDRDRLLALALARRAAYRGERPYPHAVFDTFLGAEITAPLAETMKR